MNWPEGLWKVNIMSIKQNTKKMDGGGPEKT